MRRLRGPALLALLALGACGSPEPESVQAAPGPEAAPQATASERVATERVEAAPVETSMSASGSIQARRATAIGAEVSGRLSRVFVDVGDGVEAGQPLFRIDPVPYEMALREARAGLALARAESENASQEAARVRKLIEQRAASERHHDALRTAAAVAEARVAQMEARVARALRDLECTLVRAPYAGSVVERRAHEGAMAGPEPIVVVQETGALEVVLAVPEAWPVPVRSGHEVRLFVEGLPQPLETRIERVSDRVDPETRTYEVRGPVDDPSRTVKAGSYVRAEIAIRSDGGQPTVSRSALLMRDGRTYVFRVSGERVERVPVRVGVMSAERAQILSGLRVGQDVVVGEAVGRLEPGMRVERDGDVSTARLEATP